MRYIFHLLLAFIIGLSLLSFLWMPTGFVPVQAELTLQAPNSEHWLGTDSLGRDYLSRVLVGTRVSVLVALVSSFISLVVGVGFGLLLVRNKNLQTLMMSRLIDIFFGLPNFMIIATLMVITESSSILWLTFWMGIFHWPGVARLTQSELIKLQAEPYLEATKALGASPFYLFRQHIVPACAPIWLVWFCYHLPAEIMFESSMSFLGFGVQAPQVSLGILIHEAWQYLSLKPFYLVIPAGLIFLIVLSLYRVQSRILKLPHHPF